MMLRELILAEKHCIVSKEDINNEVEALLSTMNNQFIEDAAFIGDFKSLMMH